MLEPIRAKEGEETAGTHEMELSERVRLGRDLRRQLHDRVVPRYPMQQCIVHRPRMAVPDEQDALLLLEARVVVAEPQPVVLERTFRLNKVVQARGGTSLGLREGDGRVEDGENSGGDVGARDGVRPGADGRREGFGEFGEGGDGGVEDVGGAVEDLGDVGRAVRAAEVELEGLREEEDDVGVDVVRAVRVELVEALIVLSGGTR